MPLYELATLSTTIGAAPRMAPAIAAYCGEGGGTLLGILATEIGALNQVLVLRGFADAASIQAERARAQSSASPFGCAEWLTGLAMDTYAPLPWLPPVEPGARGPIYEVRTYVTKPHGLAPLVEAWRGALPARLPLSPLLVAMHTLDGPTRFTHIWPYPTLNDRAAIRTDAVSRGIWPPKGGPDVLTTDMRSWICLPLPGSPLS
ncbi:NIPSNAP family protein [Falsiroseomonas oryzae]|uniref:NIPSNAP family protein n=1 Tax=Falsiroseomonas oryzae TaxID=2766473 RepID=UPI0022EAAE59|nr:NIPSNAP family protein [Roseomonas sp. MO-31]